MSSLSSTMLWLRPVTCRRPWLPARDPPEIWPRPGREPTAPGVAVSPGGFTDFKRWAGASLLRPFAYRPARLEAELGAKLGWDGVNIDRLGLRSDLGEPPVDVYLDLGHLCGVGLDGLQLPESRDLRVGRASARTRVLGFVLGATVKSSVLAQPVVEQAGAVVSQLLAGWDFARVADLAVLEARHQDLDHRVLLVSSELDRTFARQLKHPGNCLIDCFLLVQHATCSLVLG